MSSTLCYLQVEGREESSRKRERHGRVTRQDELMGGTCLQPEVSPRPEWVAEGDPSCPKGGTQPVLRSLSNTGSKHCSLPHLWPSRKGPALVGVTAIEAEPRLATKFAYARVGEERVQTTVRVLDVGVQGVELCQVAHVALHDVESVRGQGLPRLGV